MFGFVIAGVTGHTGSVVASELLAQGEKVKAIVRDPKQGEAWQERGAEIAGGSLDDRAFLARTLKGATGFFTLLPPHVPGEDYYAAQRQVGDAIAGAVKDSVMPRVVMLSSLGADLPEGTGPIKGLHYLENQLRATGTNLTAIRACYFQENIAEVIPAVRQAGIYPNFLPSADFAIPMIATRDIGRLAAELLKAPAPSGEIVDLVGPEYSARDLAEKLGAAIGKPLQVVDIPPERHVEALTEAGLPRVLAEAYAELNAAIGSGVIAPQGDRLVTGRTTIDEVLERLLSRGAAAAGQA
jgi:uncharacterized protein YbjT (DUF2867 family)